MSERGGIAAGTTSQPSPSIEDARADLPSFLLSNVTKHRHLGNVTARCRARSESTAGERTESGFPTGAPWWKLGCRRGGESIRCMQARRLQSVTAEIAQRAPATGCGGGCGRRGHRVATAVAPGFYVGACAQSLAFLEFFRHDVGRLAVSC